MDQEWDDLLGTGTVMKQVIQAGRKPDQDLDMEAPRKFFALIDVETRCNGKRIESDSCENFLINSEADLFPGVHLIIPLMDIDEKSRYRFDPKFGYGATGKLPDIQPDAQLECIVTLKFRSQYEEFLEQMSAGEKLELARRKKDRGKFWFDRGDIQNAISMYKSLADLCQLDNEDQPQEDSENN